MYAKTTRPFLGALGMLLAVGLVATGCTIRTNADSPVRLPSNLPSGLVVAGPPPSVALSSIASAISGSARTGEHLEVVDPANPGNPVLASGVAPAPQSMPGPPQPARLGGDPTQYQVQQHHTEHREYEAKLGHDRSMLSHELGTRLRSWSDSIESTVFRAPAGRGSGASVQVSLSQAEDFFGSLDQAGAGLGNRKVLVLISTPAMAGSVTPLSASSLAGVTVILANFTGSQTTEAEWQADFLQAGAIRAVVLSPGTQNELAPVIAQGLNGESGPAPAEVRFALNQAALSPADRASLDQLASRLSATCPSAPVTILGFADPLGSPARNAQLAQQRSMTTMAYLAGRDVSSARMFAAGYSSGLPAAPSNHQGVQPLDRRAVIVTDPAAGQPGC